MEVPVGHGSQKAGGETGPVGAADDDEETEKEDEQPPVHFVVDALRFDSSRHEQKGRADCGHHGRRHTRKDTRSHFIPCPAMGSVSRMFHIRPMPESVGTLSRKNT
jgi:hypothetical protein